MLELASAPKRRLGVKAMIGAQATAWGRLSCWSAPHGQAVAGGMTVHIFVINLPEDKERRHAIEGQLGRLGLSYEVLPAIRGAQLTPDERRRQYDEKWFVRNEGRPALPGELGCALSHLAAYRLVVERKIPYALILEDDAWLNPNLPQLLQAIEKKYLPTEKNVFLLTWISAMSGRNHGELWSSYHVAEMKSCVLYAWLRRF